MTILEELITAMDIAEAINEIEKYRMPAVIAVNPDSLVEVFRDVPRRAEELDTANGAPVVFSKRIPIGKVIGLAGSLSPSTKDDSCPDS